jgi:hypothetical protein
MISLQTNHLKPAENRMVRDYARFVLNRMVRRGIQNKSIVNIKILEEQELKDEAEKLELKEYKAWCTYDGVDEKGLKKFTIVLNRKRMNKIAKRPISRLKNVLIDLGHELVHVKQYLNNEIFDYKNGDVRHKGIKFDSSYLLDEGKYYDSPWEIEAYGREWGLYKMFCTHLKMKAKS